jgi:hypothetical protein
MPSTWAITGMSCLIAGKIAAENLYRLLPATLAEISAKKAGV